MSKVSSGNILHCCTTDGCYLQGMDIFFKRDWYYLYIYMNLKHPASICLNLGNLALKRNVGKTTIKVSICTQFNATWWFVSSIVGWNLELQNATLNPQTSRKRLRFPESKDVVTLLSKPIQIMGPRTKLQGFQQNKSFIMSSYRKLSKQS